MESRTLDQQPDPTAEAQLELPVGGMSCGACAARIEKQLRRTPGVREAGVNFATGRATVTYDPTVCSAGDLAEAVEGAGYEVRALEARLPLAGGADGPAAERALQRLPGVLDAQSQDGALSVRYLPDQTDPA